MCTVAVLALPDGGYVLGHNRDERITRRRAAPPTVHDSREPAYLAPTDIDAGGTWIATNRRGVTVCVLNALDRSPERLPQDPESRGVLARDLADCADLVEIRRRVSRWRPRLRDVRAFHLVAVSVGQRGRRPLVDRHRWDGQTADVVRFEPPALFVSALLDQSGAERERGLSWRRLRDDGGHVSEDELAAWLANHDPEPGMLSTCVHRADARTVSRTVVRVSRDDGIVMRYLDGSPCDPGARESTHRLPLAGSSPVGPPR